MRDNAQEPESFVLAEAAIRAAFACGNLHAATSEVLARYGSEVFGFLVARLRDREDAREVFAIFSEDLWRGLPNFEFRSSVRCWAYTLARNAANRYIRSRARAAPRNRPLAAHPSALERAATLRSSDVALRSATKRRVRRLREQLPLEDQTLLMLHVDRGLPWRELAQVLGGGVIEPAALERETLRVRKRFERIKKELRRLAIADGLLEC